MKPWTLMTIVLLAVCACSKPAVPMPKPDPEAHYGALTDRCWRVVLIDGTSAQLETAYGSSKDHRITKAAPPTTFTARVDDIVRIGKSDDGYVILWKVE